jgi:hypothetical protein
MDKGAAAGFVSGSKAIAITSETNGLKYEVASRGADPDLRARLS